MAFGKRILCLLGLCLSSCVSPGSEELDSGDDSGADLPSVIEIEFVESAPKDRFVIANLGSCPLKEFILELDLSQSTGMLIFDTTATGLGVEVFQPFEVAAGNIVQIAAGVDDGDSRLALRIADLGTGNRAIFTIDVDDTLPRGELGQIRVTGSEISGAIATIRVGASVETVATFNDESIARANLPDCPPVQ